MKKLIFVILTILFTLPLLGQTAVTNNVVKAKENRLSNNYPIAPMVYLNPSDSLYYYFNPSAISVSASYDSSATHWSNSLLAKILSGDTTGIWFLQQLIGNQTLGNGAIPSFNNQLMTRPQGDSIKTWLSSIKSDLDSLLVVNIIKVDSDKTDTCTTPNFVHSISVASLGLSHWYTYSIQSDSAFYWSNKNGTFTSMTAQLNGSYTSGQLDPTTFPTIYYMKYGTYIGNQKVLIKIQGR
jgi:hypothetical protein